MKFFKNKMYDTECKVYQYSADARSELHQASKMNFLCENNHRPTNFFRKNLCLIVSTEFGIFLYNGDQMVMKINWNNLQMDT